MTDPQPSAGFPPLPPLKSGAEIYDGIMAAIEPELTTAQVALLEEKYKDETPEQKKARSERYAKAMEEYIKRYVEFLHDQESQVRAFATRVLHFFEAKAAEADQEHVRSLEASFAP